MVIKIKKVRIFILIAVFFVVMSMSGLFFIRKAYGEEAVWNSISYPKAGYSNVGNYLTYFQNPNVTTFQFYIDKIPDDMQTASAMVLAQGVDFNAGENQDNVYLIESDGVTQHYLGVLPESIPDAIQSIFNFSPSFLKVGYNTLIIGTTPPSWGRNVYDAAITINSITGIRVEEMTCKNVWINDNGNFQFVFWWPYRDNNWVRIYGISGKEVFNIDMPYDNPQFEVSLPDGIYTVKTFTIGNPTPIQTFVIGKP